MKRSPSLLILFFCCAVFPVTRAQLNLSANFPNRTFLLYEGIPLELQIENQSGEGILIGGPAADARLRIVVTNMASQIIARNDVPIVGTPWLIPDGITSSRVFDLLELFRIHSAESYRVQVELHAQDEAWALNPIRFNVVTGTAHGKIRRRNVDRTFHLFSVNRNNRHELLLRVTDHSERRVLNTYMLERVMLFIPPDMRVDSRGGLHILFYKFADLMVYCRFEADGTPIVREYMAPGNRRPTLVPHDEFGFWVPDGDLLPPTDADRAAANRSAGNAASDVPAATDVPTAVEMTE